MPGSSVAFEGDRVEVVLVVAGRVDPVGEVRPEQAVGVLIRALLPR